MTRKISRQGCTLYTNRIPHKKHIFVFVEFTDHNGNTKSICGFHVYNLRKHRSIIERELLNEWYKKWVVYIEF